MDTIAEIASFRDRENIFADREDGGHRLAELLGTRLISGKTVILGIPSGGVPVGKVLQQEYGGDFDLLIVRKAQIPWNTEAGFGAVNLDGDIVLNRQLVGALGLSNEEIESQINKTKSILEQRNRLFRKDRPFPSLRDRQVILADDGLASGYTMQAAILFVKRRKPGEIILAVPTGSEDTVRRLSREADLVVCPNIRSGYPYAVASAYRYWHDLGDEDVLQLLTG